MVFKYYGYCSPNSALLSELQIAPALVGLFWDVEHAAIYKPSPQFKGVLAGMEEHTVNVYKVLADFETEFERLIQRDPLKAEKKKKEKGEKEENLLARVTWSHYYLRPDTFTSSRSRSRDA